MEAALPSKDTWLGPTLDLGAIGSTYNLTMDPYEKYDMTFNGAVATRNPTTSPGRYSGMDNGWAISLLDIPLSEFNKSIVEYPNKKRFPGGASNDMIPNLQNPENPLPYDPIKVPKTIGSALSRLVRIVKHAGCLGTRRPATSPAHQTKSWNYETPESHGKRH